MQDSLQITVRNMAHSPELDEHIRAKFAKLEKISSLVSSCRVVVEAPHKHHTHGRQYAVKLDITVPGDEIVVNHRYDEDVYVALRDAFDAAKLQLESYAELRRGDRRSRKREG